MRAIKNIMFRNHFGGDELADIIYSEIGLTGETNVELMESRPNEYRSGYLDFFFRISNTSDLLVIRGVGYDPEHISVWHQKYYFNDSKGYYNRCKRLSERYKLNFEFVYAFSDSQEVICSFLKRMKNVKAKVNSEIRKKLKDETLEIGKKREIISKILGANLSKSARIATKKDAHILQVASFIAEY